MKTISKLAAELRKEQISEIESAFRERLNVILKRFLNDFKEVIPVLRECSVKYEPCFWYKDGDDYKNFPPETEVDSSMNGNSGGICVADSILFTFCDEGGQIKKKRIFNDYHKSNKWYYIAKTAHIANDNIKIDMSTEKTIKQDLIFYLDGYFEGEYK